MPGKSGTLTAACRVEVRRREAFRELLEINPNDAVAHHNLGAVHEIFGRLDEAISEYREALRIDSSDATAHYTTNSPMSIATPGSLRRR